MTETRTADTRHTAEPWEAEYPRTRLGENFDEMREILTRNGVTLEIAMQALWEMRQEGE